MMEALNTVATLIGYVVIIGSVIAFIWLGVSIAGDIMGGESHNPVPDIFAEIGKLENRVRQLEQKGKKKSAPKY